jgi:hypothetical protein
LDVSQSNDLRAFEVDGQNLIAPARKYEDAVTGRASAMHLSILELGYVPTKAARKVSARLDR